ncbi:MAG: TonB-dependent receptor [Pseudomonadota bacterium]
MNRVFQKKTVAMAVSAVLAPSFWNMAAHAQEEAGASSGLEEVLVTASRREASMQDVSASITALGDQQLERLGAEGLGDFAGFTPGVQLIEAGPSRTQINMRGVSSGQAREDRPEVNETVGLYVDETPIATQLVSPNLGLLDVSRIEVMRGPQPTLYGAGSLSGTIRMIMNRPDASSGLAGRVGAVLSDTEEGGFNQTYNGVLNVPLVEDQLALRVAGFYRDIDGYIDNIETGDDNTNTVDEVGARVALRYTPTDDLSVDLQYIYQDTEEGDAFSYIKELGDLEKGGANDPNCDSASDCLDAELSIASLVVDYDFSSVRFSSITSVLEKDTDIRASGEFLSISTGGLYTPTDGVPNILTFFEQEEFTQEFRFVSTGDGNFDWLAGVMYQEKDKVFGQDLNAAGWDDFFETLVLGAPGLLPSLVGTATDQVFLSEVDSTTEQLAVYGEGTLRFADSWSVTLGARWYDVEQDSSLYFDGSLALHEVGRSTADFDDDGINPTASITWDVDDDRSLYLRYGKGFRLGGPNQPIPASCDPGEFDLPELPEAFESDELETVELGLKSVWSDGRVRLNASAYVTDWENPPVSASFSCAFSSIINAGGYDIFGSEVDLQAALTDNLVATVGIAYTNSELSEDLEALGGEKGDAAPYTPDWAFSLIVDYDFTISGNLDAFISADYRWVDTRTTNFPGYTGQGGVFELDSYDVLGLRAGLVMDSWQADLFITNLTDERPDLISVDVSGVEAPCCTSVTTIRPRTVGLALNYQW